ncbi:alpha/beta hydrolase [Edaphobacter sp.]|uniref:alpha/beta hydrolase n=1 Tax=Edaphobacter sp. TaxID=1934404 RepID=UPI002DBB340F|nr:alpha/beta family hydrolase [Edaphobacter sp.]HEU5340269.1 alpha/beta family hydrolase [Edaphobacter sp.]
MTHTAQIQSVEDLRGPAGRLEALLNTGRADAPYAALVCHPHPAGGGTMHNKVVYHAMKAFVSFGLPVLRFNFRGTGLSEGAHDDGRGEQDDVRAALDWLDRRFALPLLFCGFSFGSAVGLRACCPDARVKGLIGLGVPAHAEGRDYSYEFLAECQKPKLFISGDHDQYGPRSTMEHIFSTASEPKRLTWIEGADHFFQGTPHSPAPKLNQMQQEIRSWLDALFGLPATP